MIFLPGLAVVFAGLLGGGGDIGKQVESILRDLHVKSIAMPAAQLRTLTHHGEGTRELVRKLHVDGVISCEVIKGALRLVVYDHEGGLKTYTDMPLGAHGLTADDRDVLRSNLQDDITSLGGASAPAASDDDIEIDPPRPVPAKKPDAIVNPWPDKPVAAKAKPAEKIVAAPPPKPAEKIVAAPPKPADKPIDKPIDKPVVAPPPAQRPAVAAAPAPAPETPSAADDAVSADEIASLTAGEGTTAAATPSHTLHLGLAAGLGIASRAFDPGPETVAGYRSSPVAAVVLDAHVEPTRRTSLSIGTERTLQLTTPMRDGTNASTTISRWEASATYAVLAGDVELGPRLGVGRRAFSISSTDPSRSPDGDYNYLVVGAAAAVHFGPHVTLRGSALLEPVLFGSEPTEMAFGEATRWALDVGAALELRPWTHLFARVAATYQRFTWSWSMAGARGAGGAVDEYPAGAIAIGADY